MDITHFATHYPEILRKIAQHARAARGPYAVAALAHALGADSNCKRHVRLHVHNLSQIRSAKHTIYTHIYVVCCIYTTLLARIAKYDLSIRLKGRGCVEYFIHNGREWVGNNWSSTAYSMSARENPIAGIQRAYSNWIIGRAHIATILTLANIQTSIRGLISPSAYETLLDLCSEYRAYRSGYRHAQPPHSGSQGAASGAASVSSPRD
jgi:hypothetical protein